MVSITPVDQMSHIGADELIAGRFRHNRALGESQDAGGIACPFSDKIA